MNDALGVSAPLRWFNCSFQDELHGQTERCDSVIMRCFHKTSRVAELRKIGFQYFSFSLCPLCSAFYIRVSTFCFA